MVAETLVQGFERKYLLTTSRSTYGLGLKQLRDECAADRFSVQPVFILEDGTSLIRPLTLAEDAEALVNQYESTQDPEERTSILSSWRATCTGIAYKAGTTRFKIIPVCKELITLNKKFHRPYFPSLYSSFQTDELDSSQGIYKRQLTQEEFSASEFWKQGIHDSSVRTNLGRIVYSEREGEPSLGIFIRSNTSQDELRALLMFNLDFSSGADDEDELISDACFVRVVQALVGAVAQKISSQEIILSTVSVLDTVPSNAVALEQMVKESFENDRYLASRGEVFVCLPKKGLKKLGYYSKK